MNGVARQRPIPRDHRIPVLDDYLPFCDTAGWPARLTNKKESRIYAPRLLAAINSAVWAVPQGVVVLRDELRGLVPPTPTSKSPCFHVMIASAGGRLAIVCRLAAQVDIPGRPGLRVGKPSRLHLPSTDPPFQGLISFLTSDDHSPGIPPSSVFAKPAVGTSVSRTQSLFPVLIPCRF